VTQEQATAILKLKYAASDVADKALILFHTEKDYHKADLEYYIERLESALANLKRELS
jgi:hypothetical protein